MSALCSSRRAGDALTAAACVGRSLAYTAQLYFDFSGYSDMAIGLGLLFNLRLPINFAAPLRATNIIDLWRRWHISLSRFLRDFVYVPLGGAAGGPARRTTNLFLTMLLGGLWHGANWTFSCGARLTECCSRSITAGVNGAAGALRRRWTFRGLVREFTAFVIGMVLFRAAIYRRHPTCFTRWPDLVAHRALKP